MKAFIRTDSCNIPYLYLQFLQTSKHKSLCMKLNRGQTETLGGSFATASLMEKRKFIIIYSTDLYRVSVCDRHCSRDITLNETDKKIPLHMEHTFYLFYFIFKFLLEYSCFILLY